MTHRYMSSDLENNSFKGITKRPSSTTSPERSALSCFHSQFLILILFIFGEHLVHLRLLGLFLIVIEHNGNPWNMTQTLKNHNTIKSQ